MFKKNGANKRAQAILDFILVFGILLALMVGLIRIWVWFDANFAKRSVDYQLGRATAGQAEHGGNINYTDKSLTINDEWVFNASPSQTVGMPPVAEYSVIDALDGVENNGNELVCGSARTAAASLRTEADNMEKQADKIDDFVWWGEYWYRPLFTLFWLMNIDIDGMCDARDALRDNAVLLREKADEIECAGCSDLSVAPYTCS